MKSSKIFGGFIFLYYLCIVKQKQSKNYDTQRKKRLHSRIRQGSKQMEKKFKTLLRRMLLLCWTDSKTS